MISAEQLPKPRSLSGYAKPALLTVSALLALSAVGSLTWRTHRAVQRTAQLSKSFAEVARAHAKAVAKSDELYARQVGAVNQLVSLERDVAGLTASPVCEDMIPRYKYGSGILQVASVSINRGDDTERFASAQRTRLLTLLGARHVPQWGMVLMHYRGQGTEPIRRVVFNDVDPVAGAEMCEWLRCEKWSGGCQFIDEHGEAYPNAAPTEFKPTEDLYELWKVAAVESHGRGG